jgi:hypothetical protein
MAYNKVCFFTDVVSGYGGAQRLIIRRCKYLNSLGVRTYVVVRRHFPNYVLEKEFSNIPVLYEPIFDKPFSLINRKTKEEVLTRLSLFIKGLDEQCLIESQSLQEAVWAEYVAARYGSKHIFYSIDGFERFSRYIYYPYKWFFIQKYHNREVYGITKKSVAIALDKKNVETDLVLEIPFDPGEIDEIMEPQISLHKDGYISIITITRLDKQYLVPFINDVIRYCDNNQKKIYLIVCGGATDARIKEKLDHLYSGEHCSGNLIIEFVGAIKMGKNLFDPSIYFFGMGTAILNSASFGCASVVITPQAHTLYYSLFGRDTLEFGCCDKSQSYPLSTILDGLIESPHLRSWIQDGYDTVSKLYSLEAFHNKYLSLLESSKDNVFFKFKKYLICSVLFDFLVRIFRIIRSQIKAIL